MKTTLSCILMARVDLTQILQSIGAENIADTMNMDFFIRIAQEIALGAGSFIAQNIDEDRVDEWPALELHRVYDRDVPRGSPEDRLGPTNGWDYRWEDACEASGDDDALAVFDETGRMAALKSSGVWQALGDGAGGYDDTLGNPFAPFAFNSGMDTDEVSRADAIELGLLDEDESAKPAKINFDDLLGIP